MIDETRELALGPEQVARCVTEVGIGFCFAGRFHQGMRHAAVPRREIGIPTAFNFLGPLTNPARPTLGAVGCADARMAPVMAEVFARRGDSVLVLRGEDGLDEMTTTGPTRVWRAVGGVVTELVVDVAEFGVPRSAPGDLRGGDAGQNAEVVHRLLAGDPGPVRDAVLVNAAAALAAGTTADTDLVKALADGYATAAAAVDSGAAAGLLTRWLGLANELNPA